MDTVNMRFAFCFGAALVTLAGCSASGSANLPSASPMQRVVGRAMAGNPSKRIRPLVSSAWTYYNYNPSGRNLYPKRAGYSNGVASFSFDPTQFTALLTTGDFDTPGFAYANFWWSNPVSYVLANGSVTLTAPLSDPTQWSDWNGQFGNTVPDEFAAAVSKVQTVGLSFGGDCFFENGATVQSGSALFQSQFSEY
jgi:hypothetical protein